MRNQGCRCIVPLEHRTKQIQQNFTHTIPLQRDSTISEVFSHGPHTPSTHVHQEKQVAFKIVQRMLSGSPEEAAVQLPTGGQVIQFSHLPCLFTFSVTQLLLQPISLANVRRGSVTSSEACLKTIHQKCVEMSTVRAVVSGGT